MRVAVGDGTHFAKDGAVQKPFPKGMPLPKLRDSVPTPQPCHRYSLQAPLSQLEATF